MVKVLFVDRSERWEKIDLQSVDLRCYKQVTEYDPKCRDEANDLTKAIFVSTEAEWKKEYEKHLHCVDDFDIVILHTSNRWAEKFFKLRCKEIYTVLFSGAVTVSDNFQKDKDAMYLFNQAESNGMCYFVSETELINNLGDFLSEWSQQLANDNSSLPSFDVLKHGSYGARIVEAHRLCYNILTPFVALHLSLQAYCEDDNKDALMIAEIRKPQNYRSRENTVQKLLSLPNADGTLIVDSKAEAYNDYFKPLFSHPELTKLFTDLENGELPEKNDASLKTVISNIEVFAHNMEQAVSFIEFGDEPDWRMFV